MKNLISDSRSTEFPPGGDVTKVSTKAAAKTAAKI